MTKWVNFCCRFSPSIVFIFYNEEVDIKGNQFSKHSLKESAFTVIYLVFLSASLVSQSLGRKIIWMILRIFLLEKSIVFIFTNILQILQFKKKKKSEISIVAFQKWGDNLFSVFFFCVWRNMIFMFRYPLFEFTYSSVNFYTNEFLRFNLKCVSPAQGQRRPRTKTKIPCIISRTKWLIQWVLLLKQKLQLTKIKKRKKQVKVNKQHQILLVLPFQVNLPRGA